MGKTVQEIQLKETGASKAARSLGKVDNKLAKMAVSALSVAAAVKGIHKAFDIAKLSATAEVVRKKFNALAAEPDKMLASMKRATAGVIGEMTLMQKFNAASLLGLPLERFDEMLAIARGAAQATGESMEFMLNSIVTGLGRQSKLMLDNLGIMMSVEDANTAYAAALGVTVDQLTDLERKQAFVNMALDIGGENLERMGGAGAAATDKYGRLEAAAGNLSITLGGILEPGIGAITDALVVQMGKIDESGTQFDALTDGVYRTAQVMIAMANAVGINVDLIVGMGSAAMSTAGVVWNAGQIIWDSLQFDFSGAKSNWDDLKAHHLAGGMAMEAMFESMGEHSAGLEAALTRLREGLPDDGHHPGAPTPADVEAAKTLLDTTKEFEVILGGLWDRAEGGVNIFGESKDGGDEYVNTLGSVTEALEKAGKAENDTTKIGKVSMATKLRNTAMLVGSIGMLNQAYMGSALVSKRLAQGEAVINTYAAANVALKAGPPPWNFIAMAATIAAGLANVANIEQQQFARGGDFVTSGPQSIMVGDNPGGRERVQVTPLSSPNYDGPQGGSTINLIFNAPVSDRAYIRDYVIPEVKRAQRLAS